MIITDTPSYLINNKRYSSGYLIRNNIRNSWIRNNPVKNVTYNSLEINNVNFPTKITTNGLELKHQYKLEDLAFGEFFYDVRNRKIILHEDGNTLVTFHQPGYGIDLSPFSDYVIAAKLSRRWGSQPSGAISVAVPLNGLEDALGRLSVGVEFVWLDVGFRIKSVEYTQPGLLIDAGIITLTLTLEGKWSDYLKPAPYKSPNEAVRITTLQKIAEANKAVLEIPIWPVVIPRDNETEVYNWASSLDNIAKIYKSVPYWSDNNAIKFQTFQITPSITLTAALKDVKVNINEGYELRNVLNQQFNNLTTGAENYTNEMNTLNFFEFKVSDNSFKFDYSIVSSNIFFYDNARVDNDYLQYIKGNVNFKYKNRKQQTVVSGSRSVPSFAKGNVKDLSISADITGYTSNYTINTTIDDNPLLDIEETWGFLVNSEDVNQPIASKWGLIQYTVTSHNYDADGYYLGYKKTGYKKERYEIENPRKPANINDDNRSLYTWESLPILEEYIITLDSLYNYYIKDNELEGYIIEDDKVIIDKSYVEPKFVINEIKTSITYSFIQNKEKPQFNRTKGSEVINIKEIKPTKSNAIPYHISPSSYNTEELEEIKDNEGYYEYSQEFSAQGAQYNTSFSSNYGKYSKGRPPLANKLPSQYSQFTESEDKYKPKLMSEFYKNIVLINESYQGKNKGNSVSYQEASTLDDIKNCAYSDWFINNVKNNITINCSFQGVLDVYEGQCIKLICENIIYIGIILSIDYDVKMNIESKKINNLDSNTVIQLGLLPKEDKINIKLIPNNKINIGARPVTINPPLSILNFANSRYG